MNKIELLAPAGSFEKAKTAFIYGADSVYVGTSELSLRSRSEVNSDELLKIIEYAHAKRQTCLCSDKYICRR